MPDVIVRVTVLYLFVMIAFRILGKRELGRLSPFEFVTLMLIPEIASSALVAQASLVDALVGLTTLFMLVFAMSMLTHKFPYVGRLVEAQPSILVDHGRLCEQTLNQERIHPEELFAEMHKRGFERLSQVKWAILESGGDLSFIPADRTDQAHVLLSAAEQTSE